MERHCRPSMRQVLIALAVGIVAMPASAQWGGGDGAQAGATAYCAARAAGKDDEQAARAATNAIATSMGGSFASNIATIVVGGRTMWQSVYYLASKQCPQYSRNPAMQKDALNPIGIDWMNQGSSAYYSEPGGTSKPKEDAHEKCLQAADYSGCMRFQMSN